MSKIHSSTHHTDEAEMLKELKGSVIEGFRNWEPSMNFRHIHTAIVLLANGYLEVACFDMERSELRRHWVVRRTVDYSNVCWG